MDNRDHLKTSKQNKLLRDRPFGHKQKDLVTNSELQSNKSSKTLKMVVNVSLIDHSLPELVKTK